MARKTKAELSAEREAAFVARQVNNAAEYPAKLMAALEEATQKNNYELTVKDGLFELVDRNASATTWRITYHYTDYNQDVLEELEWDLKRMAAERDERDRKYAAKQAALAKLTAVERDLLGL